MMHAPRITHLPVPFSHTLVDRVVSLGVCTRGTQLLPYETPEKRCSIVLLKNTHETGLASPEPRDSMEG